MCNAITLWQSYNLVQCIKHSSEITIFFCLGNKAMHVRIPIKHRLHVIDVKIKITTLELVQIMLGLWHGYHGYIDCAQYILYLGIVDMNI